MHFLLTMDLPIVIMPYVMIDPGAGMLARIQNSLRLEGLIHGRTLLNDAHLTDHFVSQEVFGINQFVGGDITIETQDGEAHRAPDGAAILIPAGRPLRYINHHPGRTVSVWHQVRYSILGTIDPMTLLAFPFVLDKSCGKRIGAINDALVGTRREESFLDAALRRHLLGMQLFEIILDVSTVRPDAQERLAETSRLRPAFELVKKNLDRKIYIEDLAKALHVSKPHLFELFRVGVGLAPGKYIQQQRMQRAQELLVNSEYQVQEVASAVGYPDPFHFSRLFKKIFGVSPDHFRRQWRASR